MIFYFSVAGEKIDSINKHPDQKVYKGIVIEFKQYDKKYYENATEKLRKNSNTEEATGQSEVENIFSIKIPIMIFNIRDSLFCNKKQCWVSDISTSKDTEEDKKYETDIEKQRQKLLEYEKIKIKLSNIGDKGEVNQMRLHSIELFFFKLLVNSIEYFKYSDKIKENISVISFNHRCKYFL